MISKQGALTADDFDNQRQQAESALFFAIQRGDESAIAFWEMVIAEATENRDRVLREGRP